MADAKRKLDPRTLLYVARKLRASVKSREAMFPRPGFVLSARLHEAGEWASMFSREARRLTKAKVKRG